MAGRRLTMTAIAAPPKISPIAAEHLVEVGQILHEHLNRRFTQTVLSAVLHLQFFGGEIQ